MRRTLETVPIIAVAVWLGAMAFFAFCVAPAAFTTVGRAAAGQFVGVVFARYYLAGTALGGLALAGCVGGRCWPAGRPGGGCRSASCC